MPRIGSALIVLLAAEALGASDLQFYMTVDRNRVGLEDTFRVEVVVGNAPQGAELSFPPARDFEVLGRSESTQMSFSTGSGGSGHITAIRKHTLTLRATRLGKLTIPPAVLRAGGADHRTEALTIEVVKGRLAAPRASRQTGNLFGLPPGFGLPDDDLAEPFQEPDVPASDSDLFVRAALDKPEVFVGEQMTYSLHIYSRLDLSSVDNVKPPKLDGFYSTDVKVPNTLTPEQRVLNGIPYRQYLLRSRALFPLKVGPATIEPAEVDITTGVFFAGRRVTRRSNPLSVKVLPLPPGGSSGLVGQWRLAREVSQTQVGLGDPLQVKLRLTGKGNVQAAALPGLKAPPGLKAYEPETRDHTEVRGNAIYGERVVEYTLLPQQTGTFELPALTLEYFDPATRAWASSRVDPVTITVSASASGAAAALPGQATTPDAAKNQLVGGGLKALRHQASFSGPPRPLYARGWFLPTVVAPIGLGLLLGVVGLARGALRRQSPQALRRQQAKAAQRRLQAARKLAAGASATDFYAEVERALLGFLEAQLSTPLASLTRPELAERLAAAEVPETERARILAVLERCDLGRYAREASEGPARQHALEDAAAAMEGWS
jgi:BatD DUF11 like domain